MKENNKKGQLTLFVILALILVFAIGIIFYYLRPEIFSVRDSLPPLENCLSTSLDPKIKILAESAGLINPRFNYLYMGKNYSYLCYTNEYLQPCVNQEPFLLKAFEESLVQSLEEEFQECYDSSVEDLKRRGYEVEVGTARFNVSIGPSGVTIQINAPMAISAGEAIISRQSYNYKHKTNLYELLMVATSLIQFETYYGDSEQITQMFFYPNILIDKQRRGDGTKVYTITERNEGINYRFAVRSYPWPAGGSRL